MAIVLRILERIEFGSLLVIYRDCQWLLKGSKPGPEAVLRVHRPLRLLFITIDESVFDAYRRNAEFIQRYIFPGGMLPTLSRFLTFTAGSGLRTVRTDQFGEHYARTLAEWHRRFLKSEHEVERMGYGERFRRMWRYYLSYCEAGFRSGRIDLAQVLLANQ